MPWLFCVRNGKQGREQEARRLQIEAPQQHQAPIARANGACAESKAQRRLLRNRSAIRWYNRCVPAKPVPWVWKFMESRAAQVRANQRAGLLRPLLFSPFVVLLRVRFEFTPYFENKAGNRCYRREGEQDFLKHGIAPISRSAARIGLCRHAQRVPKGKRKARAVLCSQL